MIRNLFIKAIDTLRQYEMIFKLVLIYIVTLPLMKTPNLPLMAQRLQLSEVVFMFLFFLWLKDLVKHKRLPQHTGLIGPFLFFILFCILSFLHSTNLYLSTVELLGLIYLFIMFILVTDIVDNKEKLDTIVKIWIGTLSIILTLGFIGWIVCVSLREANIFCWSSSGVFPYHESFPFIAIYRTISTFRHPSGLANYLTVSLGFVISDLLLTKNKRYKAFLEVMIFFICLVMLTTVSRNLLGFMLSVFLIYNNFHKVKKIKFRMIKFVLISIFIIAFLMIMIFGSTFHILSYKIKNSFKENHKELLVNIDYAYDIRLAYKIAALEMLKRHPFLGVGLAMFPSYAQGLNKENYFYKNLIPINDPIHSIKNFNVMRVADPHNDFLGYFAETGIFGGTAFIIFIATFLSIIITNLKNKMKDDWYFQVRLFCFFASFMGVLIDSIDFDVFKIRHIWFLMALISSLILMHKNKKQDSSN